MKVYQVEADWKQRTPQGNERPTRYTATRQEARDMARDMATRASRNQNLGPRETFVARVFSCEVSERLGKGRLFAVSILNGRGIERGSEPLDEVKVRAASARCDCCGKSLTAQALTPTGIGSICSLCFDDQILFDPAAMEISARLIEQSDLGEVSQ